LLRQFFPTPDRINKFMDLTYCQKSRAKAGWWAGSTPFQFSTGVCYTAC
jgi:hypothetical protein